MYNRLVRGEIMLQSKAKWNFVGIEETEVNLVADSLQLSPVIQKLLLQRGITTEQAAAKFLQPDFADLHNPHHLQSIDKATKRVHQAIKQDEKILVFGDYDADGVTATAVLVKALLELGAYCDYYIPNRFTEGYGPNEAAFRHAYEQGYQLIITVDNGIAAIEEAEIAKELGMDLIITDHHEIQDQLPDCYAIIHPKCSPNYPFHELAGVGVAFKFAQSLLGYFPYQFLDYVAIGTIADLVPLIDENRILAYHGLRALTHTKHIGLKALKQVSKVEGTVTEEDVGFLIGPRLNAVGRLQSADMAVDLLLTEDPDDAREIAHTIEALNEERQLLVQQIVTEAEQMLAGQEDQDVIIVAKEGWNEGVLGIVASKLVRKMDRPAIVLTLKVEEGIAKGSARSISAFNLFENCMQVRHLFNTFGGHSQAAGMTLPIEQIGSLQQALNKQISEELQPDDFKQEIQISQTISLSEITIELIEDIQRLAPFGMHNPKPLFHIRETPIQPKQIGSMKNHLKLQFKNEKTMLDGIGFGIGELFHYLTPQTIVHVVGELSINEWNGHRKPQIMIEDICIADWQLFDHRGKKAVDLAIFVHTNSTCAAVGDKLQAQSLGIPHRTYEDDWSNLKQIDTLFIFSMPEKWSDLEEILIETKPKNIHLCYYIEDSTYLRAFPSRDDFKWMYHKLLIYKSIHIDRKLPALAQSRGWNKDKLLFIIHVFYELQFIHIEDRIIKLNPHPAKRNLQDSETYQKRLQQAEIERILYYSTYEEVKNYFAKYMDHLGSPKEEPSYGL
jgi:single-stranded-DNA-specific exonuclease